MKEKLTIGSKWSINYGSGNRHNKTVEIRAVVDNAYVVYVSIDGKYKMDDIAFLELIYSQGKIQQV